MKKIIIVLSTVFVFTCSCQILSSDKTSSPEISIEPSPIIVGQEIEIKISSPEHFIMPYCGGVTYEIDKLESEIWIVYDGHYGPCNALMKPEVSVPESIAIQYTINEEGMYRFASAFKFNSNDEMEPIYSDMFEVVSER